MRGEYAFDGAGGFIWEEGVGCTVDLSQRNAKGKSFTF